MPSSLYARWPPALAQTAVPLVVNALTQSSLGGAFVGRWTVQCRSYRMATETSKRADGQVDGSSGLSARSSRTLVVVRSTATPDEIWTFVEDPKAPARKMAGAAAAASSSNGNGGASTAAQSQQLLSPPHTRWSTCNFVAPAAPVDTFLHRVLTSGGAGGQGAWTSKPSTWIFEGLSFLTGATPLAPGGEWLVRVGSVTTKGGAKTQNKGVILHATYLPVPSLPQDSPFIEDFLKTLFPRAAVENNEIRFIKVSEDEMYEAGYRSRPPSLATAAGVDIDDEDSEDVPPEAYDRIALIKMLKQESWV